MEHRRESEPIEGFERIFNVLGWMGFLAIFPVALRVFGLPGLQESMERNLGRYGTSEFLLLVFFALIVLRVVFGSDRSIGPLLLGSVTGFVLIAPAAGVGFMQWLRSAEESTLWFANQPLLFLVGVLVVMLGVLLSGIRRLPMGLQILALVIVPAGFLVAAGSQGWFAELSARGVVGP